MGLSNKTMNDLKKYWNAQGVLNESKARKEDIQSFESYFNIIIPNEIKEYFFHLNGMPNFWPKSEDEDGFSFWSWETISTFHKEKTDEHLYRPYQEEGKFLLVFADYLSWSWAYVLELSYQNSNYRICTVGFENLFEVTQSFTDFLNLYIADDDKMYGP